MRKSKKQKEDRYFLLTMLLSVLSILCFEVTFFKEYKVFMMVWLSIFLFFELWLSRIIGSENELKKSWLSIVISSLSIVLFDMIIMVFSNQIISYIEIGKYFLLYFFCFSLYTVSYQKFFLKKKILSKILFAGILLSNLLLNFIILK